MTFNIQYYSPTADGTLKWLPSTPGAEDGATASVTVEPGQAIGRVGALEVRSPFAGLLMGYLAVDTERVTSSQPIAWLRTA